MATLKFGQRYRVRGWHLCCPLLVWMSSDASHHPHWKRANKNLQRRKRYRFTFTHQWAQINPSEEVSTPTYLTWIHPRKQRKTRSNQPVTWRQGNHSLLFTGTCPQSFSAPVWRIWIPSTNHRRLVSFPHASRWNLLDIILDPENLNKSQIL